ncbi:MAG: hypothetical protein H8E38_09875 [SAR324 cluster bacterium]|nr:hypothetical protein [SAR324 cluster bacterium]
MKDQKLINKNEWENPANWTSGKWGGIYFSHEDSRTWVPKRIVKMGWTLNLAKPAGLFWLIGFLVGIPLLIVLAAAIFICQ